MSINIEEIISEEKNKRSILKEVLDFFLIFSMVFAFGWLFINAQLIIILIDNLSGGGNVKANEITLANPNKEIKIEKPEEEFHKILKKNNGDNFERLKKELLEKKLNEKLKNYKGKKTDNIYKPSYNLILKNNLKEYNIKFNTLPPSYRILIPKINIDVPVVNLTNNIPIEKIEKADYDEYLYNGVVKYPYTPDPGEKGNIFIFGHTSYYWWKKNPYGTVFANIPKLKHGDEIEIIWNSKVYKYKIFKKLIVFPNQVDDVYLKYKDGEYLTIMGCYPIGSDRKRMIIISKRIKQG